jgi:hypothetical protein
VQLFWGSTPFPVNAAAVTGSVQFVRSGSGRPIESVQRVEVGFTLFGAGQKDLSNQEGVIRAALMTPYQDLILRRDDGGIAGISLINNSSLSGCVVVSGPDFGEAQGSEYVTTRRGRFVVEATYLVPGAQTALVSWTQTVSVLGNGGPRRTWREPVNAAPIRQVVKRQTVIRYTQSGQAVGHLVKPFVPPPIFGRAYLVNESEAVQYGTGEPLGRSWRNWPVSWNYVFESDRFLVGTTPLPVF